MTLHRIVLWLAEVTWPTLAVIAAYIVASGVWDRVKGRGR